MTPYAVILTDLDKIPPAVIENWLSEMPVSTRNRVLKFYSQRRIKQFVTGRYLLSTLLTKHAGISPQFIESGSNRPRFINPSLHCSISHSNNAVMAGVSMESPIGVDIEQHKKRDFEKLVKSYFHADELCLFDELEPEARSFWFYHLWTCKEALSKAAGNGLTLKSLEKKIWQYKERCFMETYRLEGYTASIVHLSHKNVITTLLPRWDKAEGLGDRIYRTV